MSQAAIAPISGARPFTARKSANATGISPDLAGSSVVRLPVQRRLRPGVPPFDPANPRHIAAWEALFDYGQQQMEAAR